MKPGVSDLGVVFSLAVYFVIWWLTLFTVLPFGVRTQSEAGEVVPGTPSSAPAKMNFWRVFVINTVVSGVVFAIVWLLIANGIVATDMFWDGGNAPV